MISHYILIAFRCWQCQSPTHFCSCLRYSVSRQEGNKYPIEWNEGGRGREWEGVGGTGGRRKNGWPSSLWSCQKDVGNMFLSELTWSHLPYILTYFKNFLTWCFLKTSIFCLGEKRETNRTWFLYWTVKIFNIMVFNHWRIYIQNFPAHASPQWDPILWFSHTFSPKSAYVGGPPPPKTGPSPHGKSWFRPCSRWHS